MSSRFSRSPSPLLAPTVIIEPPRGRSMSRGRSTSRSSRETTDTRPCPSRSSSRSPRRFSYLRSSRRRAHSPSYSPARRNCRSRSRSVSYSPVRLIKNRTRTPSPFVPSPIPSPSPIIMQPPPTTCCFPVTPQPVYQPYPFAVPAPGMSFMEAPSAELLTYSLAGKLAYVPAGKTYEEALDHALAAFPSLAGTERVKISLHVAGRDALVRVTAGAWSAVLKDLPKYEIVTVVVEQPVEDAPPEYDPTKANRDTGAALGKTSARKGPFGWLKALFGKA